MVQSVISISVTTNWPMRKRLRLSGQVSIRWIENKVNSYLNSLLQTEDVDYVIASDTDSIYLNFGPLVDKFFSNKRGEKTKIVGIIDQICQDKLEPFIEKSYQDLATYVNALRPKDADEAREHR